jgi:hypothetical protein
MEKQELCAIWTPISSRVEKKLADRENGASPRRVNVYTRTANHECMLPPRNRQIEVPTPSSCCRRCHGSVVAGSLGDPTQVPGLPRRLHRRIDGVRTFDCSSDVRSMDAVHSVRDGARRCHRSPQSSDMVDAALALNTSSHGAHCVLRELDF